MFDEYNSLLQGVVGADMWRNFKVAGLTEVIHQKDDADFIHLLNIDNTVENILKVRFISKKNPSCPIEALDIFAENRQVFITKQCLIAFEAL